MGLSTCKSSGVVGEDDNLGCSEASEKGHNLLHLVLYNSTLLFTFCGTDMAEMKKPVTTETFSPLFPSFLAP